MLLLGPTDSHIIIHNRENQSKERQLASRQGSWQGSWEDSLGGQEKIARSLKVQWRWAMVFCKFIHVWGHLDLEREQTSMRLESVFIQARARDISKNHASRALRCFLQNHACCHWSQKADTNVSFTLRTSAKKGGWEGGRILQGPWKYHGGGRGFSASLSVSIPLGLEYVFLQGLWKILLSFAPKRKPKQLQHSPLEQV